MTVIDRDAIRRPDPGGYTLVLPPGWRQIPVRDGTSTVIREIVDDTFRVLPKRISRDRLTPYRVTLQQRLTAAAAAARSQGGTELYFPVEPVHGTLLAASFIASEGTIGMTEEYDPALIISWMSAQGSGSATVTLDGSTGVRTEHAAAPDPASGADTGSRRVDYVVRVPGAADRWLVFAFSALSGGDPGDKFAGLLVNLFDSIMSTFRWSGAQSMKAGAR